MNRAVRGLILTAMVLGGCQAAHDVAVTSYRVATAPVRFVRDRFERPAPTTTTTTTTTTTLSDVTAPGEPVPPPGSPPPQRVASKMRPLATVTPSAARKTTAKTKPKPSPSPRGDSAELEFPTAKPVAGKPGYVYSPFDPDKYVDVSGYARGSKVKDPYSGKIFLVP
jgi:hypothetical protein